MRLIDRYIFKQVLITCAACVGFFVFLIAAVNALKDMLGYVLSGQLAPESAGKLILLLIPYVIMYALPMGMLLGVLLVLGRMSADSEIVALRTCGLSIKRICAPIFVLALAGIVGGLAINYYYMPIARTVYHEEFSRMLRTNALRLIIPKTFVRDFPGAIIYVSEKHDSYLKDIWLWRLDKYNRMIGFSHAETGRVELDKVNNALVFRPFQLFTEELDSKDPEDFSKVPPRAEIETTSFSIPLTKYLGTKTFNRKQDWLTLDELHAEQENLAKTMPPGLEREQKLMRIAMIIQNKTSMALSVFILVLIAVPLGIKVSRRETSANLGVALVMALMYYFLSTVVVGWFDKYPQYHPDLLVWVPNLFFIGIGLWMNLRVEKA